MLIHNGRFALLRERRFVGQTWDEHEAWHYWCSLAPLSLWQRRRSHHGANKVDVLAQDQIATASEISLGKQMEQEQITQAYQEVQQTLLAVSDEAADLKADYGTPPEVTAVSPTELGATESMPIVAQIATAVEAAVLVVNGGAPSPVTDLASTELGSSKAELEPITGQKRKKAA